MNKTALWLLFIICAAATDARALTELKGNEARGFLGDAKTHLVSGNYSYDLLSRNHRDAMNGRFSDGILFCPSNGKIEFLRRRDGEVTAVFGSPNGRAMEPVSEAAWTQKLANAIADDNPNPTVYLDDAKRILGIVMTGSGTQLKASTTAEGLLKVELSVPGARGQGRIRRKGPF